MAVPRIGAPARGSSSGRPIMVLFDLLGRRSTLRILWELRNGPLTFRGLQEACETNPALLNTRLKELRATHIVELSATGYALTAGGTSLLQALQPLSAWAERWAQQPGQARRARRPVRAKPAARRRARAANESR